MVFDLAMDFTAAVDVLPPELVNRKRLRLLDEALRRDLHFIARHAQDYPQALYQCLWNSAWWYACPDAAGHYVAGSPTFRCRDGREDGVAQADPPPTGSTSECRATLHALLEQWRTEREAAHPGFPWLRSLRPPLTHLGAGTLAVLRGHELYVTSVAFSPDGRPVLSGSGTESSVWDAQTGECLEILQGSGDITAIAAGAADFPWRAMATNGETVIESAAADPPVAWFREVLNHITTHSEGRTWAGAVGKQLILLRLEGR